MPKIALTEIPQDLWDLIEEEKIERHARWRREEINELISEVNQYYNLIQEEKIRHYDYWKATIAELLIQESKLDPDLPLPLAASEYFYYHPLRKDNF